MGECKDCGLKFPDCGAATNVMATGSEVRGCNNDVMYGFEDSERLDSELDAFIEYNLDECDADFIKDPASILTVYTYRRTAVKAPAFPDADDAAERIIERLDEEYGDPDGDDADAVVSDKAKELYAAFVAEIVENYVSWACEIDKTVPPIVVNVREWVEKNAPDCRWDDCQHESHWAPRPAPVAIDDYTPEGCRPCKHSDRCTPLDRHNGCTAGDMFEPRPANSLAEKYEKLCDEERNNPALNLPPTWNQVNGVNFTTGTNENLEAGYAAESFMIETIKAELAGIRMELAEAIKTGNDSAVELLALKQGKGKTVKGWILSGMAISLGWQGGGYAQETTTLSITRDSDDSYVVPVTLTVGEDEE